MAYQALLHRPMDPSATHHIERLRAGTSKTDTLLLIKESAGRSSGAKVEGLSARKVVRWLENIPVFGYFVSWLICLIRLPRERIHQERTNQHIMGLLTRLEVHLNANYDRLENALAIEQRKLDLMTQGRERKVRERADAA
jgi:hypothetical protein